MPTSSRIASEVWTSMPSSTKDRIMWRARPSSAGKAPSGSVSSCPKLHALRGRAPVSRAPPRFTVVSSVPKKTLNMGMLAELNCSF